MRFLSYTWRLSLALAALIVLFISAYMMMAKHDFEADKMASVLEGQRIQVKAASLAFARLTDRALFDARAIMAGYDRKAGQLNPGTQRVFWENPNLLAVEFTQATNVVSLEKLPGFLDSARQLEAGNAQPRVQALGDDRFVLAVQDPDGPMWRVVFESRELLPPTLRGQVLALSQRGRLIKRTPEAQLPDDVLRTYIKRKQREPVETRRLGKQRYMISSARLGSSDVVIAALTPVSPALAPVDSLFNRGILFGLFAFLSSLTIAALLSRRLQTAFNSEMRGETALRIQQTAEFTRRDEQEKSATHLSESVYPRQNIYKNASLRLAGPPSVSKPGQWWFYFQREFELFVFTATTSDSESSVLLPACRALFSHLQTQNLTLREMAKLWDKMVFDCCKGKATMNAQLMQVHVELGEVRFLNAGATSILHFQLTDGTFTAASIGAEPGFPLGEQKDLWLETELSLQPGSRLLLGVNGVSHVTAMQALYAHRTPNEWLEAIGAKETLVALDFKSFRS